MRHAGVDRDHARDVGVAEREVCGEPGARHLARRIELREGHPAGYQFQVIGEPEDDLLALLGRLIEKMRRALALRHIEDGTLGLQITDSMIVRGKIESDLDEDDRLPLLVIDGREVSWAEFGRMLMTFEGWQFKLEIADKSDEL